MFSIEKTYSAWTGERILRHICYWLAWLFFYATVNSNYHDESFLTWVLVELMVMPIKLTFTYFVIYYLIPRFLIPKAYFQFACWTLLLATIGGFLFSAVLILLVSPTLFGEQYPLVFTYKTFYKILDLLYTASIPAIIKLLQRSFQQEKKNTDLVAQKIGAELQLLKNQLQPHFLFNTLNNLYGLVLTQDAKAPQIVLQLSGLISYMLYDCDVEKITLAKEIEHLKNYIELERMRYGERLDVSFETGGELNGQIAPLLLIPFLENAFKHGVADTDQPAWIRCNCWGENGQLSFKVENSLPVHSSDKDQARTRSGIGLQNTRKRLDLIYGDQYELETHQQDSFLIHLKIPLS